jgi:Bardet-Biedl syndrome 9 protein
MSLFRAREWWSTTCGNNEEFDQACLAVGNVDDAEDGEAKIVVGGFSGVLRAYAPKKREFEADHLILEHDLRAPVLQISMSDFGVNDANGEARTALAVLHPRKLRVFVCEVVGEPGAAFHELRMEYEHALAAPACNMTVGPFKGSAYDGICVQTLDGVLEVFDRERMDFRARLPDFLVPGPLAYCPRMDAFVTVNSKFEMEKFSLKTLAGAKTLAGDETAEKTNTGPEPDWRLCLGEGATQITSASGFSDAQVVAANGRPSRVDLVALGERHLFVVSESGEFLLQKRLDYAPSVMHAFRVNPSLGERSPVHVFVADCTGAGMLYRGSQTLWAAKFDKEPVAMLAGARFGGVDGMLVTLTENGNLAVAYLGTAPPVDVVRGYQTNKEVGFAEMERERAKLTEIINSRPGAGSGGAATEREPAERIELSARVPTSLDPAPRDGGGAGVSEKTLTIEVLVTFTGSGSCEDVTLTVAAPAPATCRQETFVVPFVRGGKDTPSSVRVALRVARGAGVPASNVVRLVAGYRVKGTGEPRVATHEARVPLCLFAERIAPVKHAAHKVTLDTNRAPPLLASLFDAETESRDGGDELRTVTSATAGAANVVSFAYGDGSDVTVIVSKNAGRYRLQSSSFGALWLVLDELCHRLRRYYRETDDADVEEPFSVSFGEALPLQDFFAAVDAHHALRLARNGSLATLSDRARQFRAAQKRLLVRFKDKNPQTLTHLDAVLTGAYDAVVAEAAEAEHREEALRAAHGELAAATRVVVLLMKLKFQLSDAELATLEAYLSADEAGGENDVPEQGWEEWTEAATTSLLKTKLAKGGERDAIHAMGGGMGTGQPLPPTQDTSKLKKHIAVVCERLARGARLAG